MQGRINFHLTGGLSSANVVGYDLASTLYTIRKTYLNHIGRALFPYRIAFSPAFHLRTTLNGIDLKSASHELWSEKQNILLQHMHKTEF